MNRRIFNWEFLNLDTRQAWHFLGWVSGDGSIGSRSNVVFVGSKDLEIIEGFRNKLCPEHKISIQKDVYFIQVNQPELRNFLKYLDLKHENVFNKIPREFLRDFIRGFFEADGCVRKKKNGSSDRRYLESSFTQKNKDFLRRLKDELEKVGIKGSKLQQGTNNCWVFYLGEKASLVLAKWMYEFYEGMILLRRKYFVFKEYAPDMNPIYKYRCILCKGEKEELRKIDERDIEQKCMCGGKLIRILEGQGTPFKMRKNPLTED